MKKFHQHGARHEQWAKLVCIAEALSLFLHKSVAFRSFRQRSALQFSRSAFCWLERNATAKMVWGIVAAAVAGGVALLVLLWLVSVPLYGCAPVPFKTCFARLVRTTAKPKRWSFTRIEVSCTA